MREQTTLAELGTGVADLQEAEAEASDKVKQRLPRIDELKQIIKANRDRTAKWKVRRTPFFSRVSEPDH